jgi:glyoxalase family protein
METAVPGIHHVTAIAGDPQQNVDFYTQVMGLRLVKVTINYDDPGTYHFYFGSATGRPGTILTFFPWPGGLTGRRGTGQVTTTSFAIPANALGYWRERLQQHNVTLEKPVQRFVEEALSFYDPDGLQLELVTDATAEEESGFLEGPVPPDYALRGFHGITLSEEGFERTAALMTETLGFRQTQEAGNRFRFEVGEGGAGRTMDILCQPGTVRGRVANGTVHHIAWRTAGDAEQAEWRERLVQEGYNVSPVMDRQYFHSIYFREPGGVLFEIATDPPGFTADERPEELGTRLRLPDWMEPERQEIERLLPPLKYPGALHEKVEEEEAR